MLLGFALTEHCNLRCPHCIRDDVTTVRNLDGGLLESVVDQAIELFGPVAVSLTGGEPLLHPGFERIVAFLASRDVPWRFVSNAWHLKRVLPLLERHPPESVRLSLSGASEETHDAHRGRGSFRRVLLGVALLASRRIPASLSMVIDKRDRHQLGEAAELAEALGCQRIHFILPQPVPGSAECDSDLPPEEWLPVRREIAAIAGLPGRRTVVALDYGAPFDGPESPCDTFSFRRLYVDTRGRVCTCCQLSQYGFNEAEVVADLNLQTLAQAYRTYMRRVEALVRDSRPATTGTSLVDPFPCLRCARVSGKLSWLNAFPQSAWHDAALQSDPLYQLTSIGRRGQTSGAAQPPVEVGV
jgi:MoaA/NifB/PqqE/SkfB family radical SAM enzyme